jgi:hypothetical protein
MISVNHRNYYLGIFKTKEEAAKTYDIMAYEWFGKFAHLNFPLNIV